MRPHPLACTIPPAWTYATGGLGCRFILGDPDRAASRRGRIRYCDKPRFPAASSYCEKHGALCEIRLPRRHAGGADLAFHLSDSGAIGHGPAGTRAAFSGAFTK